MNDISVLRNETLFVYCKLEATGEIGDLKGKLAVFARASPTLRQPSSKPIGETSNPADGLAKCLGVRILT